MKKQDSQLPIVVGIVIVLAIAWWLFSQWWFWVILVGLVLLVFGAKRLDKWK